MLGLLLAALAAAPCLAAEAPVSTAAVATSTAAFAWTSTAPLTVGGVLSHFEAMDAALVTLQARFTQSMTMRDTGVSSQAEGVVDYKKPEHLRIEHLRPERQLVVSDGDDIWIWRRDRDQVIQSKLADWKKADPALGNLMEFGDYARMMRSYDVALDTAGPRAQLVLRPKKAAGGGGFTLRLILSPATLFPEETRLTAGSVTVDTVFTGLLLNPVLPESDFTFTPPPGADVFRNFKPPRFHP